MFVFIRFATTYQCNNSHTGVSDPLQRTARATHRQCSTRPHVFDYFGWMGKFTPCYRVKGDQVLIITEPTQFYEVLKVNLPLQLLISSNMADLLLMEQDVSMA